MCCLLFVTNWSSLLAMHKQVVQNVYCDTKVVAIALWPSTTHPEQWAGPLYRTWTFAYRYIANGSCCLLMLCAVVFSLEVSNHKLQPWAPQLALAANWGAQSCNLFTSCQLQEDYNIIIIIATRNYRNMIHGWTPCPQSNLCQFLLRLHTSIH